MADKKISQLPIALAIDPANISVLVGADTDYQFSFTTLLSFVATNLSVGSGITFGITILKTQLAIMVMCFSKRIQPHFTKKLAEPGL